MAMYLCILQEKEGAMSARREVEQALKDAGAVLVRHTGNGHEVYRLNGKNIIVSVSPSDRNWVRQVERDIRRARVSQ